MVGEGPQTIPPARDAPRADRQVLAERVAEGGNKFHRADKGNGPHCSQRCRRYLQSKGRRLVAAFHVPTEKMGDERSGDELNGHGSFQGIGSRYPPLSEEMSQFTISDVGLETILATFAEFAGRASRTEVLDESMDMRHIAPIDIEHERGYGSLLIEASASGDIPEPIHLRRAPDLWAALRELEWIKQPILRPVTAKNLQHGGHGQFVFCGNIWCSEPRGKIGLDLKKTEWIPPRESAGLGHLYKYTMNPASGGRRRTV